MSAPLPPDPPSSWSASAFDLLVDELCAKTGISRKDSTKIVTFYRTTWGITPYDGATKSLRDNLEALVKFTNQVKANVDTHSQAILDLQADVQALKEVPPARPFP